MGVRRFLFIVFFISGFCGLLYQVVWLRMAFAAFGVITPVISVILSVFMLGLSLGSWIGGSWVEKASTRSGRSAIVAYGAIELFVGIGALLVPFLFSMGESVLLSFGESDSAGYLFLSAAAITLSILPWCILMGATFPAMMAFVREFKDADPDSFSFLYVANVLGAAFGALLTAVALVEILGFAGTLRLGALFNVAIAVSSLLMGREFKPSHRSAAVESSGPAALSSESLSPVFAVGVLFITGFSSMAMEVVWTRAFTPVMRTSIYAFASLLATYLVATWIGSVLYRKHLKRNGVMPVSQALVYLSGSAFLPIVLNDVRFDPHPFIVCLSIVPLCAFLGYLTPRLIDGYSAGRPRHAGKIYAVNILGCIAGPLVAGYGMLPFMSVKAAMIVLAVPFLVLSLMTLNRWTADKTQRNVTCAAAVLLCVLSMSWSRTSEEIDRGKTVIKRDHTATVIAYGDGMEKRLLTNGIGMTSLTPICKYMAHWPALHRDRKPGNFLVICFGMGTTFRSGLAWEADVTAVELVPGVRDVFDYYHADAVLALQNPKGRIVIDDGRRFLKRTQVKYDIITVDPPPPAEAAGSSLLYSKEFIDLIKERLSDDGILAHWFPQGEMLSLKAAARSLVESFPHVRMWGSVERRGMHFLCSNKPIPRLTTDQIMARMPPAVEADLQEWGRPELTARQKVEYLQSLEFTHAQTLDPDPSIKILDDRPFNEYFLLRQNFGFPPGSNPSPFVVYGVALAFAVVLVLRRPRAASSM